MIASLASLFLVVLVIAIIRWVMTVPLMQTLNAAVDQWADGVQGEEPEPLREI